MSHWIFTSARVCPPAVSFTLLFLISFVIKFTICPHNPNILRHFMIHICGIMSYIFFLGTSVVNSHHVYIFSLVFISIWRWWSVYSWSFVPEFLGDIFSILLGVASDFHVSSKVLLVFLVLVLVLFLFINIIILLRGELSTSALADIFSLTLSDSMSPQVSSTFLSILADHKNAKVSMVSVCPLISNPSCPCTNPLQIVPSAPITISITNTKIYIVFFQFSCKVYELISLFSFFSLCAPLGRQTQLFCRFVFFTTIWSGRLAEIRWSVFISKSQRS